MDKFSFKFQIQGETKYTASSGKCIAVRAGNGTALPVVGICIDTRVPEDGTREISSTRRRRDENGDNKGFVVIADAIDDLVIVVARGGGGGGIGFPINTGGGEHNFEGEGRTTHREYL